MALKDFKRDIFRCDKCGGCIIGYGSFMPSCPSGERFGLMAYYARGMVDLAYGLLTDKINWSDKLSNIVYACADCKMCETMCTENTAVRNLDVIMELKHEAVERGSIPLKIRDFLEGIDKYGNPYQKSRQKRSEWAKDLGVREYSGEEFLFFVGCVGSYDEIGQRSARAFAEVLLKSGVSFGILGNKEICDGNEVSRLGEKGLFEKLAEKNIALFKESGVSKVITISPHAYNAIKNEYLRFGGKFEVSHSTQFMQDLLKAGKIQLTKEVKAKVTYHDPCWLGRRNGEYDAPRKILQAVPGIQLVEMTRNRQYSYCCGGGGGNFISDVLGGGEKAPASIRVREAVETGADLLVVACPICARMLEDAVKSKDFEDKLNIKDISEIVRNSIA